MQCSGYVVNKAGAILNSQTNTPPGSTTCILQRKRRSHLLVLDTNCSPIICEKIKLLNNKLCIESVTNRFQSRIHEYNVNWGLGAEDNFIFSYIIGEQLR